MKKTFNTIATASLLSLAFFVFTSGSLIAADIPPMPSTTDASLVKGEPIRGPINGWSSAEKSGNSCFDYYKFQSVQVSFGATKDSYAPSDRIVFKGDIINQNDYPVINGSVFARFSQKNQDYMKDGNFIIDEVVVLKDIALDANEKQAHEFNWTVPQDARAGDYRIDFFFAVGNKFNLGGLPFTNEVIVGSDEFKVTGNNVGYVSFERSKTQVNDQAYHHIGNWPVIEPGKSVTVSQSIANTFDQSKEVNITYDLFYWDSLNELDKVSTKQETINLLSKESKALTYTLDKMDKTVYYLRITAKYEDQQSIINTRFVSEGESPRLNFPAITKFPIKKGESVDLFSCYHNTSSLPLEGRVIVALTDRSGNGIIKTEYSGTISSAMSVTAKEFSASDDYDFIKLSAKVINKSGQEVDSYEATYDCDKLHFESCQPLKINQLSNNKASFENKTVLYVIAFLVFLFGVVAVIVSKRRRGMAGLFLLSLLSGIVMSSDVVAYNDKSVATSAPFQIVHQEYYWASASDPSHYGGPVLILQDGSMTVTHNVGMISGGESVNIDESIDFTYNNPEMSFDGLGGNWGSPYGVWRNNLDDGDATYVYNSLLFNPAYGLETTSSTGNNVTYWPDTNVVTWYAKAHTAFTGIKPVTGTTNAQVHMISSDPSVISCDAMTCTPHKAGVATLTAQIPETQTRAWSIHEHNQGSDGWAKYWEWNHAMYNGIARTACVIPGSCQTQSDAGSNILPIPAATVSWEVTVNPPPSCNASTCVNNYRVSAPTTYSNANATCQAIATTDPDNIASASLAQPSDGNWNNVIASPDLNPGSPTYANIYWVNGPGISSGYEYLATGCSNAALPATWSFYRTKWCAGEWWNPVFRYTWYYVPPCRYFDNTTNTPKIFRPKGPVLINPVVGTKCIEDVPFYQNDGNGDSIPQPYGDNKIPALCEVCECDPNPTLTLTATPSTIGYGTGVTTSNLSWTSNSKVIDNTCVATSSPADSSWNGSGKPKSSNQNVSPTQTTGYTLTCNTTDPAQPTITSPTVTVTYVSEPCVPDLTPICYNPTPVCGDTICGPVTGVARCVPTKGCGVASVPCGGLTCDANTKDCPCPNKDWIEVAP